MFIDQTGQVISHRTAKTQQDHQQMFFWTVLQEDRTCIRKMDSKVSWSFLLDTFHNMKHIT